MRNICRDELAAAIVQDTLWSESVEECDLKELLQFEYPFDRCASIEWVAKEAMELKKGRRAGDDEEKEEFCATDSTFASFAEVKVGRLAHFRARPSMRIQNVMANWLPDG
jgi:hypothetical protein